jgi:hypothetical protein
MNMVERRALVNMLRSTRLERRQTSHSEGASELITTRPEGRSFMLIQRVVVV